MHLLLCDFVLNTKMLQIFKNIDIQKNIILFKINKGFSHLKKEIA